ncbi:MAG: type IV pilus modification protein PilV [Ottowia sp.]|nr:type IV pilus modification protein PilV [Ottowia sp.]
MMIRYPPSPRQAQCGASLLEVLIAILIMSFGMLGIAGLTAASLKTAKLAQFQSTALQLVNEYAESMRGNIAAVRNGDYEMKSAPYTGATSAVPVPGCDNNDCTPAQIASIDKAEWINNLRRRLPAGGAYVDRDGLSMDIWIIWQEPDLTLDEDSTLSVAGTGGNACPDDAIGESYDGDPPVCMYYRVSL